MVLFVVLTLGLSGAAESAASSRGQFLVDTAWVAAHLKDPGVRIVDVRPAAEYLNGHIEGAVQLSVESMTATRDGVKGVVAPPSVIEGIMRNLGIGRGTKVVLYDASDGKWASYAFWVLEYHGHPSVAIMDGSLKKWVKEKRPLSQAVSRYPAGDFKARPIPERIVTTDRVARIFRSPGVKMVDTRNPEEFERGHIPGAINLPMSLHLEPGEAQVLKSAEDLNALYRRAGIAKSDEVITYCTYGYRSSFNYFVLRLLGHPNVRLYDGALAEWRAQGQPVEKNSGRQGSSRAEGARRCSRA
jgi:thiosulfate/3-mercaptopyruvate sulfurtransferase